jgi:integrase
MNKDTRYRIGQDSFTPNEVDKLLSKCTTIEDETLIKFELALGLRREDAVNVLRANINFKEHTVTYSEKKKHNRIRIVFMGEKLETQLQKYMNTLPAKQKRLFDFCGKTAYNHLQSLCDAAGIRRRPFHALRATCIKRCQAAGWTLQQTCALVGDTPRVVQEHYEIASVAEMADIARTKEVI